MQSTRVKQFLLKKIKFVFCCSNNTTKLYLSGSHNSKVAKHKIIRVRFHSSDWIFSIKSIFFSNFLLESFYCNCCLFDLHFHSLVNTYKKRKLLEDGQKFIRVHFIQLHLVQQREHKKQP